VNTKQVKVGQILRHCSFVYEAQRKFIAFHLALPTSQTLLNLVKEWENNGMFDIKEFNVQ
jgi:hypothetical protein